VKVADFAEEIMPEHETRQSATLFLHEAANERDMIAA
jgi:hypothetical protein